MFYFSPVVDFLGARCGGHEEKDSEKIASRAGSVSKQGGPIQIKRVVALLRAVNVGGTGKLAMKDLVAMCETAGFSNVRTYIASGNAIFDTEWMESKIQQKLGDVLANYAGKPVPVMVRDAAELRDIIAANPFPGAPGNRTIVVFLDEPPPADALDNVRGRVNEEMALGKREIYIRYDDGMANSKLNIPAAKAGTARNMNTVVKLSSLL